ncbi:hypothetical protein TWF281_003856 [Arthrobotrys megalospora]
MASQSSTETTPSTQPSISSTPEITKGKLKKSHTKRRPRISRRFYITIRNISLIFFIIFPMAHMASWALTIWMLGRGADKLAASLGTTKPFDDIAFRNTMRDVIVSGARGWRINVIMLSLETACAIIGGFFLIRGLRRARRLIIEVEDQKDLEGQGGQEADKGKPAVL